MRKAIYKITNKLNGKIYIGQSVNPYRRFAAHCSRAKTGEDNYPIHSAIKKYGKENFELEILEWTEDYNEREKMLIKEYNSKVPNGYNLTDGGEDPPHKCGEEHPTSIVSNEELNMIICLLKYTDMTTFEIGSFFKKNFKSSKISLINLGLTYRRKNEKYPIRATSPYHLSPDEIQEIKWLLKNTTIANKQIAEYYGVNPSAIKAINSGRNHHDDNENYPIRKFR